MVSGDMIIEKAIGRLPTDADIETMVAEPADVDVPVSRQAIGPYLGPARGSTRRGTRCARPGSLTTLRLLASYSDRHPDKDMPALSDESFPAKPERRGVEVDPGGIEPPSRNGSTIAILRA